MNKLIKTYKIKSLLIISLLIITSCVEEIQVETQNFENAIVVEAVITNENKHHVITLSKTFSFEEETPNYEINAKVEVYEEDTQYLFSETSPGIYASNIKFSAKPNKNYKLLITTSDGNSYSSDITRLTESTPMDELFFERGINENGEEGVSVFVNTYDPNNKSNFYRFEYEETYKIVAPLYSPRELIVINRDFPIPGRYIFNAITDYFVELRNRTEQKQICYNTVRSNKIKLASTIGFSEDKLEKYRVRFINRSNYIITHRYSILVKQFVQSREAYTFYKTLNQFSESESILSENQPGFIAGNISSLDEGSQTKIIGFFEVSSVDTRRIYFNYEDLFPGEELPPYAINCIPVRPISPALWNTDPGHPNLATSSPLVDALDSGFQYYDSNPNDNTASFPYEPFLLVQKACGDCTALGETKIPDFWED